MLASPNPLEQSSSAQAQDSQQSQQAHQFHALMNSSQGTLGLDYSKIFEDEMFQQQSQTTADASQMFAQQSTTNNAEGMEPTPLGQQFQKNNSFLDGLAFLNQYNANANNSSLNAFSSGSALNAAFQSNSALNAALSSQNNAAFPQFGEQNAVFTSTASNQVNNPFSNVMFIVDPTQQKLVMPKQTQSTQDTTTSKPSAAVDIQQLIQQGALAAAAAVTPAPSPKPELPPLRALSAYNFFFRDERDRILNGGPHDWSDEKQQALLQAHWGRDRTKKRRHRKTHGKIDFTTLSKLISQRWKELGDDNKEFYRQVASQDWERYQKELSDYKKQSQANEGTLQIVA